MKRWIARLALCIASLVVTLLACELVARILLPPQQVVEPAAETAHRTLMPSSIERRAVVEPNGHINAVIEWGGPHGVRLRPNVSATIRNHPLSRQDVRIETNSLGLRYGELGPRQPGEYRILVLGDSITFADYVDERDTFTMILERQLAESGYRGVRIINAGLPGASTRDEYYHYLELADYVRPDLVLVAMYLNDVADSQRFYVRALRPPYSQSRFLLWVVRQLDLVRLAYFAGPIALPGVDPGWREQFRAGRNLRSGDWAHSKEAFDFEIYNAAMDFGLAWNPQTWRILHDMVAVFRSAVVQRRERFAMMLLPVHIQVLGTVEDAYPQQQFARLCRGLAIDCLDTRPALRAAAADKGPRLFYDHCHLTADGNAFVAKALKEWLGKTLP